MAAGITETCFFAGQKYMTLQSSKFSLISLRVTAFGISTSRLKSDCFSTVLHVNVHLQASFLYYIKPNF
jgi:hypothetical protein